MNPRSLPGIRAVTMPKWGIEMQEGTITAWNVAPGGRVEKGEPLLDVETEKIVNSVESPASGVLRRVLAQPGDTHPVGALIAVLAEPETPEAEIESFILGFKPADASFEPADGTDAQGAATPAPERTPEPSVAEPTEGEARVSPIARRLAERLGIDLSKVVGTGRHGRISKEDVEAYAAKTLNATPSIVEAGPVAATEPTSRTRLTSMRATIARRLSESKREIPHYRLVTDLDVGPLVARRASTGGSTGPKVSINDLLLAGVARALVAHPGLNAQFNGEELLQFSHVDLAVAVATQGGLVTPIVRRAESLPLPELASAVRDLAERARAGRLKREEITGGTFTVSNLGMFGVRQFDAIINPPQVAILAVGAVEPRPVVRDGALAVGQRCTVTLSSDHRVVDGAVAAGFLATLQQEIFHLGETE